MESAVCRNKTVTTMALVVCLVLILGAIVSASVEFVPDEHTLLLDHFETVPNPDIPGAESKNVYLVPGRFGDGMEIIAGANLSYPAAGNVNNDEGTIELWMNPAPQGNEERRHLVSIINTENQRLYLRLMGLDRLYVLFYNDGTWLDLSAPVAILPGNWHHVALTWTFDGRRKTTATIYFDGRRVLQRSGFFTPPDLQDGRIWVGSYTGGPLPFNGIIDELRISSNLRYTAAVYASFAFKPELQPLHERLAALMMLLEPLPEQETASLRKQAQEISSSLSSLGAASLSQREFEQAVVEQVAQIATLENEAHKQAWWQGRAQVGFSALPVSSMDKINSRWESAPKTGQPVQLAAAGNETTAFQVVLLPGREDLKDVGVSVSPLTSSQGMLKEQISVYRVGSVQSPTMSKFQEMPLWADPLFPLEGTLTVPQDEIQALWFTVDVPADTPAGDYTGEVVLTAGNHTERVPVKLHVYDFSLPTTPRFRTAFGLSRQLLANTYQIRGAELDEMTQRYVENMLAHKVTPKASSQRGNFWAWTEEVPFLHPTVIRTRDGHWKLDFTDYDQEIEYYLERGLNTIMVGGRMWDGNLRSTKDPATAQRTIPYIDEATGLLNAWTFSPINGKEAREFAQFLFSTWYDHLKEKGWDDLAYTYLVDEPAAEMYSSVTTFNQWVHEFAPGLPNMITKQPDPMMQGVDIWCPLTPFLDMPELETHLEQGGTLWTYVCSGPGRPHANFFLHQSGLTNRIPLWLAYKYGAEGFLYWEHAWWYGRDPWTDQSFQGLPDTWGDGLLVYAGPDGPINSIRFEVVREGIQDVEYFLLLEELVSELPQESPERKQAEKLLVIGDDLIRSPKDWSPHADAFLNRKAEVAKQIELLLQD